MEIEHQAHKYRALPIALIPLTLALVTLVIADASITITDNLNLTESIQVNVAGSGVIAITDNLKFFDQIPNLVAGAISVITTTITSIITQIGTTGCGGSCFFAPSGLDNLITTIVIPAIFLVITGFGVMYMGIKSFGVLILTESFIFMGLAFLGIIPSWFTLLIILFVSAALSKIVWGFFRGGGSAI